MQTEQAHVLAALRGAEAFLEENATSLPEIAKSGARQELKESILELSGHVDAQKVNTISAHGVTEKHRSLRTVLLRDHMAPIARIAHSKLPQTPELASLKMPRGNPTIASLGVAAGAMGKEAARFSDVFIASGLPADFIAHLDATTTAMLSAVDARRQILGKAKGATSGLKAKLVIARRTVRVLDAFVRTALKDDTTLLSNWKTVTHVTKSRVRTVAAAPVTPTAAPASAPTATPVATSAAA